MMSNSRIKRFIERHKDSIVNEAKLKISLNIEVEIYIGSSQGKLYYLVITPSNKISIRDTTSGYDWYEIKDYDWIY